MNMSSPINPGSPLGGWRAGSGSGSAPASPLAVPGAPANTGTSMMDLMRRLTQQLAVGNFPDVPDANAPPEVL